MNKLSSLRIHLLSLQVELPIDPSDLDTFAGEGKVEAAYGDGMTAYTMTYELNVLVKNFSGDAIRLFLWVMVWIRNNLPVENQHYLKFDLDILNDQSSDVRLIIKMEEIVKAIDTPTGIELIQCGIPTLDDAPLDASVWTLFSNGPGQSCQGDPLAEWMCKP